MKRIYLDFLIDIKTETVRIQKFIKGITFQEFLENDEKIYAVCRSFEIIGEAVKRIPKTTLQQYQDVNWKEMAQMRDRLIHYYYWVDEKILWDTVKNDIPLLQEQIQKVIEKEKLR
jgi:uncharacterized protein with HEPN domain